MFTHVLSKSNWVEPPVPPPPPGDWEKAIDFTDEDPNYFQITALAYDIGYDRLIAGVNVSGGADDHVWKSDDEGVTWSYLSLVAGGGADVITHIVYDAAHSLLVCLIGTSQIYTSADGGATWTFRQSLTGGPYSDSQLIYDPSAETVIFTGRNLSDTKPWNSDDGGLTWTQRTTIGAVYPTDMCFSSVDNAVFLLLGEASSGNSSQEVWRTTNGGDSWNIRKDLKLSPVNATRARAIIYDVGMDWLMISSLNGAGVWEVWSSDDEGIDWDNEGPLEEGGDGNRINQLAYHVGQSRLYAFDYGDPFASCRVFSSLNGGRSWVMDKAFHPDPGNGGRAGATLYVPAYEMMFAAVNDSSPFAAQLWKSNGRPI